MSDPRALSPKEDSDLKMEEGLQRLYTYARDSKIEPDGQGIISVPIPRGKLDELKGFFPIQSEAGTVVHIFTKGANVELPPIRSILEARVEGFYRAANTMLEEKWKNKDNDFYFEHRDRLVNNKRRSLEEAGEIAKILLEGKEDVTAKLLDSSVTQLDNRIIAAIYRAEKAVERDAKLTEVPEKFQKALIKVTKNTRASKNDIVTVIERKDGDAKITLRTGSEIAAHDRYFTSSGPANASLIVSGDIKSNGEVKINTSFNQHSTPVPIDEIHKVTTYTRSQFSNYKKIVDKTKENIKGILGQMAQSRLHGGDSTGDSPTNPMKIDWFYEILTTNVILDNQGITYEIIVKAIKELEEEKSFSVNCRVNGEDKAVSVKLNGFVLNAGIGNYLGLGYDDETVANNKKAFNHMFDLFKDCKPPEKVDVNLALRNVLDPDEIVIFDYYSKEVNECHQHILNLYNAIKDEKFQQEKFLKEGTTEERTKDSRVDELLRSPKHEEVLRLYNEKYQKAKEEKDTAKMRLLQDQMTYIRRLDDMAQAYKLFKTDPPKYKDPAWAPIFLAYCNNVLQTFPGVKVSDGCKSGNDRSLPSASYKKSMAPEKEVLSRPKKLEDVRAEIKDTLMPDTLGAIADNGMVPKASGKKFLSLNQIMLKGLQFCKELGDKLAFHKSETRKIPLQDLNGLQVRPAEVKPSTSNALIATSLSFDGEDVIHVEIVDKETKYEQQENKEDKRKEKEDKEAAPNKLTLTRGEESLPVDLVSDQEGNVLKLMK